MVKQCFSILYSLALGLGCCVPIAMAESNHKAQMEDGFDEMLSSFQYPFAVDTYRFVSQGTSLDMAYMYLEPKRSALPTVLLLHGKNFNGAYWEETAKMLNASGYGVVIPDQIGFGKSSKPTAYQYSFEALAKNTKNLLDYLSVDQVHVIGHSMGGMLASRFALLFPEKTEKVTLVNPLGLENYLRYVEYKDIDFFYKNELGLTPERIRNYQKAYYYDGVWNDKYEALAAPLIGWVIGPDWDKLAQISARVYDMIFTGPVVEEFKYFQMPAHLIIGTRDRTGPGRNWKRADSDHELGRYDLLGMEVRRNSPNVTVIELGDYGHAPQIENFEVFKEALLGIL
jgi:pimeloyl-ACP methyl ester carboxylesterase